MTKQEKAPANRPEQCNIRDRARSLGLEIPLKSPFTVNELNQLYPLLRAPIRQDAVERSSGRETGKGYDTTGFAYQALVDRLNEVLGPGHWEAKVVSEDLFEGAYRNGRIKWTYELEVEVDIGFPELSQIEGRTERHWVSVLTKRLKGGTHEAPARGDAYKGAYTNGLKKCLGFIGVGADAYLGMLDEENQPLSEDLRGDHEAGDDGREVRTPRAVEEKKAKEGLLAELRQRVTKAGLEAIEVTKLIRETTGKSNSRYLTVEEIKMVIEAIDQGEDAGNQIVCEDCGKPVTESVRAYSRREFGRGMCMVCQNKEREKKGATKLGD